MSEETKTAAELSDEQLKSVAGGEGGSDGSLDRIFYRVTRLEGAVLHTAPSKTSAPCHIIGQHEVILQDLEYDGFILTTYHGTSGFVSLDDVEKITG